MSDIDCTDIDFTLCPFCKEEPEFDEWDWTGPSQGVYCTNCGAEFTVHYTISSVTMHKSPANSVMS